VERHTNIGYRYHQWRLVTKELSAFRYEFVQPRPLADVEQQLASNSRGFVEQVGLRRANCFVVSGRDVKQPVGSTVLTGVSPVAQDRVKFDVAIKLDHRIAPTSSAVSLRVH
jgi:hypothetical protein